MRSGALCGHDSSAYKVVDMTKFLNKLLSAMHCLAQPPGYVQYKAIPLMLYTSLLTCNQTGCKNRIIHPHPTARWRRRHDKEFAQQGAKFLKKPLKLTACVAKQSPGRPADNKLYENPNWNGRGS